jgi:hypothetical protein
MMHKVCALVTLFTLNGGDWTDRFPPCRFGGYRARA